MTDNTKLKSQLKYSPTLGCIIVSVRSKEKMCINIYSDIPNVVLNQMELPKLCTHAYLLQV